MWLNCKVIKKWQLPPFLHQPLTFAGLSPLSRKKIRITPPSDSISGRSYPPFNKGEWGRGSTIFSHQKKLIRLKIFYEIGNSIHSFLKTVLNSEIAKPFFTPCVSCKTLSIYLNLKILDIASIILLFPNYSTTKKVFSIII